MYFRVLYVKIFLEKYLTNMNKNSENGTINNNSHKLEQTKISKNQKFYTHHDKDIFH